MIHTADLIANRREYAHMKLEDRKHLFLPLFYFIYKSDICISSIIINKKYFNSKIQLRKEIKNKLIDILDNNQKYFLSFQKIIIYYDNGQEKLDNIIKDAFARYNYEIIEKFNHQEERLFQVADMLTFIDKLNYKRKEKLKINNSEKYFLSIEEYRKLIKELSRKRLKH